MKFAKVLQQTLVEEDLPEEWVEAAIQYKVLKKCISRVVKELEFLGLSKSDLKLLLQDENTDKTAELTEEEATSSNPIVAKYLLTKLKDSKKIVPYLKITLNNSETEHMSQDRIQELAQQIKAKIDKALSTDDEDHHIVEIKEEDDQLILSPTSTHTPLDELVSVQNNEIIVMLKSDSKFFKMLNLELENLDKIRQHEEARLIQAINSISDDVLLLTKKRSDLYNWRELFRIYLDSEVFFRYNETSLPHLERNAVQVKRNMDEFMSRVEKTQLLQKFNKKRSITAYKQFVEINDRLLKILQFQAINTTALRKILKKFDKRTSLNVSTRFPELISQDHIFITGSSLAQSICFVMQSKLITLIPQLDDYTCPICVSVAFKPIRLVCGHIFCVRCLVKMKQRNKTNCPLCRREGAIAMADSSNLDLSAMDLMQKYFPLEVKEKLREIEKERYEEVVGTHKNCVIT